MLRTLAPMDPDLRRLFLKIVGAAVAILALAGGLYFCNGSRPASAFKTGCVDAGHQPTDPSLARCVEQAQAQCTTGDDAERDRCAQAIGVKLLGGQAAPLR
jgi:hypothetical protein